jgi:SAM-dependent methyltransferase
VTPTIRAGDSRLDHILARIDLATMRGLEIGPLHNPLVSRADGEVFYVDHASTDDLRAKYAADKDVAESDIVDVDFVWGDRPLLEAVGAAAPFDYVVASHVIEHVPDPVGWIDELSGVLRPGGVISLVIPDKRYCFDTRRRTTDVSEIVAAHLERRTRPSLAQIFDFWSRYAVVDCPTVWAGGVGHAELPPAFADALARCRDGQATDGYIDVHATTWTPESFLECLGVLFQLGWLDVRVAAFAPTPVNSLEFFVSLERLPDGLDDDARRALQLESLPSLADVGRPAATAMPVSDRERRLLEIKRGALSRARRVVGRLRR